MKQANYNGRLRAALAALGVALTASHRLRGAICLDIFPACRLASRGSIRGYARLRPLRGALLGLRAIGLPIAFPAMPLRALLSEQLGCRLRALRCRFSLAADGNQRGELAMPICPVGAVRCSVAFP